MAKTPFTIKLNIDSSQADAAAKRSIANAGKVEQAWGKAATAIEASINKMGAAMAGFSTKSTTTFQNVRWDSERAARASETAWTTATKASTAGFAGMGHAATSATNTIKAGAASASTALGGMGKNATKLTSQLQSTSTGAASATSALNAAGTSAMTAGGHVTSLGSSIERMLLSLVGVGLLAKSLGAVGTAAREAREAAESKADASLDQRSETRELASLMHENGPNDRVMARVYGIGMASGYNFHESNEFAAQFEGTVPLGIERGNLREEQKKEVEIAAARSARRLGIDAGTAGDMAGSIAGNVDLNKMKDSEGKLMSAADAMATQLEAIAYGLNEGRGKISTLARGEIKDASKMVGTGRIEQRSDVGAFLGIASQQAGGPGAAASLKQLDNLLNRSTGKEGDFLKSHGISALKGNQAKLHRLKEVIDEAQKSSNDPNFNANTFLAEEGFGSQEERSSTTNFLDKLDSLDHRIKTSREKAKDVKGLREKNAAFERGKESQKSRARVAMDYARFKSGVPGEDLQIARMNAAARLEGMGLIDRQDQKVADAFQSGFGATQFLGMPPEVQKRIDDEVGADLRTKLSDAGIEPKKAGLAYDVTDPDTGEKFQRINVPKAIKVLQDRGIDTSGNATALKVEAEHEDTDPKVRAQREAWRLPHPVAPVIPPIKPLAALPNGTDVAPLAMGPGVAQGDRMQRAGGDGMVEVVTLLKKQITMEEAAQRQRNRPRPLPSMMSPNAGGMGRA